jgi:hypothetical protein
MPCPLTSDHTSHRDSKLENTPFPPPTKKKERNKNRNQEKKKKPNS